MDEEVRGAEREERSVRAMERNGCVGRWFCEIANAGFVRLARLAKPTRMVSSLPGVKKPRANPDEFSKQLDVLVRVLVRVRRSNAYC